MPASRPNCVSVRFSSLPIWMPMMEKIVHTAKQMVKAKVERASARLESGKAVADMDAPMAKLGAVAVGKRHKRSGRPLGVLRRSAA